MKTTEVFFSQHRQGINNEITAIPQINMYEGMEKLKSLMLRIQNIFWPKNFSLIFVEFSIGTAKIWCERKRP